MAAVVDGQGLAAAKRTTSDPTSQWMEVQQGCCRDGLNLGHLHGTVEWWFAERPAIGMSKTTMGPSSIVDPHDGVVRRIPTKRHH